MNSTKTTTFDSLVSQMTSDERRELLSKMRPLEGDPSVSSFENAKENSVMEEEVKGDAGLSSEPLLYRIILWLRSVFSSISTEQLYNDDKVMSLYRKINREYPGLVDYKGGMLLSIFYEKLLELKKAADFFKPYLAEIYNNIGAFYVYLGSFIAPEVTETMNTEVDPNNLPLDRDVTNELRASLLRKMEDVLKEIPSDQRAALYNCAVAVEWLNQFTRLPFELFIGAFANGITDSQVARFETVATDLNNFSKVLCNGKNIPAEALESIYLYSAKKIIVADSIATDDDSRAKEFMDKSSSFMSIIHMFITTVPLRYVNKIAYNNINWQPGQFGGAEDWFVKFKEHWKRLFDEQWNVWLSSKRKSLMNTRLKESFGIDEIPFLPNRPWAEMWGGIPFHFENTAGFLYWFTTYKLPSAAEPLKTLLLEAQFVRDENRSEFADTLNELDEISAVMYSMNESLSRTGQTGMVFDKLASEHLRTIPAQSKIESLMLEHEHNVQRTKERFCNCIRSIQAIMGGVFGDKKDTRYDGITNLGVIKGGGNVTFRMKLSQSVENFNTALGVLKELEQIDIPVNK